MKVMVHEMKVKHDHKIVVNTYPSNLYRDE